jgi:hypothetical protein
MTVDVAGRRTRRSSKGAQAAPPIGASERISIGEIEQTVFSCPSCQRPLALGAKHCPGCRTRLVSGVQLSKASLFVTLGVVVGLAVGLTAGGAAVVGNNASRDAEIAAAVSAALAAANIKPAPVATNAPAATSRPVATAKPLGGPTGIPPIAVDAMRQSAAVNAEMAAAVPLLQSALRSKAFDTYTVFQVLRSLSGNAVTGRQLAVHISGWSGGTTVATTLTTFYGVVQQAAGDSLDASIRNTSAYKRAAADMITLLAGLAAVDAELRAVAADAKVTLPAPATP